MVCCICVAHALETFQCISNANATYTSIHLYYTLYFYQNRVYFGVIQKLCILFSNPYGVIGKGKKVLGSPNETCIAFSNPTQP